MMTFFAIFGIYCLIGIAFAIKEGWPFRDGEDMFAFAVVPIWPVFAYFYIKELFDRDDA